MLVETILGQEIQKHPLTKNTYLRSSSQSIKKVLEMEFITNVLKNCLVFSKNTRKEAS